MKNLKYGISFLFFSCILIVVMSAFSNSNLISGLEEEKETIYDKFEQLTDSVIKKVGVPGMVVGVWAPDQNIEWVKAKGKADLSTGRDMKTTDLFRIGSNTKPFVITALLQLVDEEKVALSDTLGKYLPQFPKISHIKLRTICNMTSGIFGYSESYLFREIFYKKPLHSYSPTELVDISLKHKFYFEQEKGYHYSNTNTVLAGMIIEKVTENTLKTELEKRFIKYLNMRNSSFAINEKFPGYPDSNAKGYGSGELIKNVTETTQKYDMSWAWAAGAMISNLYDMKIWLENLVDGSLLSKKMQSIRLSDFIGIPGSPIIQYGLGWFRILDFYGHNGSCPGFQSFAVRSKKRNATFIIMYNAQSNISPDHLFLKMAKIIYSDLSW
jgi:D-alanyl-D-alanine carboxypeptidase